ncbi:MFS transporter [Lactiplantibacillus daowaiensis]|uniref:MFS transporter n=1 Tax=Lactiplantibacillus daowaiensis TaxID=2559918 RepID=A0ABW1S4B7_9LACO|nr:MFS transporter [Lactiplantibacillus daowaiensis]
MSTPNKLTTTSILSLSFVSGVTTVITGIIPQLTQQFPTAAPTLIEWLVTSANLSALITLLLNPYLTRRFGSRHVVISGLLLSAVAGALPLLLTNLTLIMASRIILGLGIGLFSPHAIGLIAHTYHGELRARLLGYQTGLSALGNAVLLVLAGWLVLLSWRAVFLLYLILAVLAFLAVKALPATTETTTTTHQHAKLPASRWILLALTFMTYLLIWGVQLKLPTLFTERHFGNASVLNLTLAAMNLGGLLAGLTFGKLHQHLHRYTLMLGYAGAALTVFILWWTTSAPIGIAAAVGFNFIYSYTGPYLVFTSQADLTGHQIDTMSSRITIATIISAFFAPLVWNWLGTLGPATLTTNVLGWIAASLTLLTLLTGLWAWRTQKG